MHLGEEQPILTAVLDLSGSNAGLWWLGPQPAARHHESGTGQQADAPGPRPSPVGAATLAALTLHPRHATTTARQHHGCLLTLQSGLRTRSAAGAGHVGHRAAGVHDDRKLLGRRAQEHGRVKIAAAGAGGGELLAAAGGLIAQKSTALGLLLQRAGCPGVGGARTCPGHTAPPRGPHSAGSTLHAPAARPPRPPPHP